MPKKNNDLQYTSNTLEQEIDKHTTSIKLLSQSLEYMQKGIDEIKLNLANLRIELQNSFVTKESFERLRTDVIELKNLRDWAIKIIVGSIILALLALLGLNR